MIIDNGNIKNQQEDNSNQQQQPLSREISTFLALNLLNPNELADQNTTTNQQKLESESTIDLSEILLQDQYHYKSKGMSITDNSNNQFKVMTIADANSLNNSNPKKITQAKLVKDLYKSTNKLVYLDDANNEDTNDASQDYYDESENTSDTMNTQDYEEDKKIGEKRKAITMSLNDRNKRVSTTSTTSSLTNDSIAANGVTAKRGRGSRGGRTGARVKALLKKPDEIEDDDEENVARFGNKYVVKDTSEYHERRNKNNDAVKRCRAKIQEKQKEREDRLKELTDENRKLANQVDSLTKELNVLKGILSNMNPQFRLPNDLEEKIKRLENLIMANSNANNNSSTNIELNVKT